MSRSIHTRVPQGLANLQRREFLRRGAVLSAAGAAAPWALSLAAMGEAAAAGPVNDYKALVCVFLYGANDHGNTPTTRHTPACAGHWLRHATNCWR